MSLVVPAVEEALVSGAEHCRAAEPRRGRAAPHRRRHRRGGASAGDSPATATVAGFDRGRRLRGDRERIGVGWLRLVVAVRTVE